MIYNGEDYTSQMVKGMLKQQENIILEQLSELLDRKLLVIESTQPVLTNDYDVHTNKHTLTLNQAIRLKLRDQEYIEQLEKENKEYKEIIEKLKNTL